MARESGEARGTTGSAVSRLPPYASFSAATSTPSASA